MNRLLAIFINFAFAIGLNNLYVFGWCIVLLIKKLQMSNQTNLSRLSSLKNYV